MAAQIEEKHLPQMNAVASVLDDTFKGYGFMLLVFDKNSTEGRMNYICNCRREEMLIAMKEFIANNEGRVMPAPSAKQ